MAEDKKIENKGADKEDKNSAQLTGRELIILVIFHKIANI